MTETKGVCGRSRCGREASSCPSFLCKREEGFFRRAIARDQPERPIGDLLLAGEPFVRPGEKNGAGKTTTHHAVDMPAEHFGLFLFAMPDRVHAELAQHERLFFREVLQAEQVAFEVALVVQINVEAVEIDVLREEILRRRIARVGKEHVRIGFPPDADERARGIP